MGIEDLGLLLENIEEYVMEQKKVVTYKWLSRVFSLNVNQAKQLLCIFHMKHKNMKHKSIQGVYYVSGMRTNSQGHVTHQVCIVPEDDLEATKAQLDPITGVHLYSVQKGRPKDTAPIYAVDFEQLKKKVFETTEFSMVRCEEAKISEVINSALRPVTPPALKNKVKVMVDDKPKGRGGKLDIKKSVPSKKQTITKGTAKTTTVPKKSTVKPKQEYLSNFFSKGKAEIKKFEPKKPVVKKKISPRKSDQKILHTACMKESVKEELTEKTKIRITSPGKKTKPLEPPVLKVKPLEPPVLKTKEEVEPPVLKVKPLEPPVLKVKLEEPPVLKVMEEEMEPEKKVQTYSRLGSKRKRVRKFSDEDDDKGEEEDQGICLEEDENQFVLSEEKPPECKKTKINGEKKKKRVKKLVSKTSINEEGFMETEKVWEEQICTDDEVDETEEISPTLPTKTKQSNLMGFFKKS